MKRRDAILSLAVAVVALLALLTAFAIELSNTQAKSKNDVVKQVHERGQLAAALINSLFNTVAQQIPNDTKLYGGAHLTGATLDKHLQTNLYSVVLNSSGQVIAHSRTFTPQLQGQLASSRALAILRQGKLYGLGNYPSFGTTGALDLAVRFPSATGVRTLVYAFRPAALTTLFNGSLQQIPGVKGTIKTIHDGNLRVIASTSAKRPTGYVYTDPKIVAQLRRAEGDNNGFYFVQVPIANSGWQLLIASPDGPLFASVTGLRKWVPWILFAAFAIVAIMALALGRRALAKASEVHTVNRRLEVLNHRVQDANAALERRAAELARSNAELEQFASIASHDLQEPLRKVRTFTQQVIDQESGSLSDRGRDYLDRASTAASRMQQLIEDLLRFSRVSTQGRPFAPVNLSALAEEVLGDLEATVQEAGAVVTVGELPTLNGDSAQLRQLLQNLISNGLKFRAADRPCEVDVHAEVIGEEMRLDVHDNGIGFDPRYERRIFRVFERLHSRTEFPGTGIGLALCRKIVERHGGTISATSEAGAGATFTITLPLHQREEVLSVPGLDLLDHDPEAVAPAGEKPYVTV